MLENWSVTFLFSIVLVSIFLSLPKPERAVWGMVLILAGVLFVLQWYLMRSKDRSIKLDLTLYVNLLVMGAVILTKITCDLVNYLADRYKQKSRVYLLGGLGMITILLAVFYVNGALAHPRTINTDMIQSDQSAYMDAAIEARQTGFHYAGDFNRMPLYSYLLAVTYRQGMSDQEFFAQGKQLNIILSFILLIILFVVFTRFLSIYNSFLLAAIIAFSLFIFKAGYVKVELLYYFLAFLAFLWMLQMLHKPGIILAIATGIATGLAYLAKASALLGLYLFIVVYLAMVILSLIKLFRKKPVDGNHFIAPLRNAAYLCPHSAGIFCDYIPLYQGGERKVRILFLQYQLDFFIWFDDFETAKQTSLEYGFNQSWPTQMPPDEIPSPQKYLREHSAGQIIARILSGLATQAYNLSRQYTFQTSY